jgi:hypothetical protein
MDNKSDDVQILWNIFSEEWRAFVRGDKQLKPG